MNSRVFRIVLSFGKPHPILLSFIKGRLYLISLLSNISLGFSEDATLLYFHDLCLVILTTSFFNPNTTNKAHRVLDLFFNRLNTTTKIYGVYLLNFATFC